MSKSQVKTLMEERREKVKELYFVRRYSLKEVAKTLDCSFKTIWGDAQYIKREASIEIEDKSMNDFLKDFLIRNDKIIQECWKMYYGTSDIKTRAFLIGMIQKADINYVELLERMGVITSISKVLNVQINVTREDVQKRIAGLLEKKEFIEIKNENNIRTTE